VERIRQSRRHPRPKQFDYLHMKRLVATSARPSMTSARFVTCSTFTGARARTRTCSPPARRSSGSTSTVLTYLVVKALGLALEAVDRRFVRGRLPLPMNLLLTARRPT